MLKHLDTKGEGKKKNLTSQQDLFFSGSLCVGDPLLDE